MLRLCIRAFLISISALLLMIFVACSPGAESKIKNAPPVQLEFFETYTIEELYPSWMEACKISGLAVTTDSLDVPDELKNGGRLGELVTLTQGKIGAVLYSDRDEVKKILQETAVKKCFPKNVEFVWGNLETNDRNQRYYGLYAIKIPQNGKAKLTGKYVQSVEIEEDEYNAQLMLHLTMNSKGAAIWEDMTGRNIGRSIAITIDRTVYVCPRVNEAIGGGNVFVTGNFTKYQAEKLAAGIIAGR